MLIQRLFKFNFNIKKAIIYKKAYTRISELNLFDETFYNEYYSEYFDGDALEYYLVEGYKKGHDPSIKFDTNKYLRKNPDVKKMDMNPLVHYALYGINENRDIYNSKFEIKNKIINQNKLYLNNYEFKNEPLVSIIVLNKDGLNHLELLLKDFSRKTNYKNFEFILVDNASSDESVDYVKSLNVDFPIKIIENKENLSFSKANNEACKIADGDYLLLLNNDMEPTEGWLNEMMGVMLHHDNVGSVGAKLVFPKNKKWRESFNIQHAGDIFGFRKKPYVLYAYHQYKFANPFNNKVSKLKKVVSATAACLLIKKSIFEEIGGFDEGYIYGYEDVDLSLKLNKANYDIYYCPNALLFHHESSTRKISDNFHNNASRLNKKWWCYLNKKLYLDKINNENFFCETPLSFVFVVDDWKFIPVDAKRLAKLLNNNSYVVDLMVNSKNMEFNDNVDVVVSFTDDLNQNINIRENTIKILFSKNKNDFYDITLDEYTDDFLNILTNVISNKFEEKDGDIYA